jgi:hypothetical protein
MYWILWTEIKMQIQIHKYHTNISSQMSLRPGNVQQVDILKLTEKIFEINNYSWIGLKGGMSQTVLMTLWAIMIIEDTQKFVWYVLHEV